MYEHILVPTDGSERFGTVIREAITLASLSGATVHAVYVIDTRAVEYARTPESRQETMTALRSTGESATGAVARAAGEDVQAEETILEGTPHKEILRYADEIDADIIVMGTHGRTGLNRVLIGSVAERVIRLSDRPVVAVKLGEQTISSEDDAIEAAVTALEREGHTFSDLRDDPYRESMTWVVPVTTEDGTRINVHVDASSGDARLAQLG